MIFVIYKMEKIQASYNIVIDESYRNYCDIIIDVFENDNLNYDLTDSKILNIIGLYYCNKIKNYVKMEKYYLMAIELKNVDGMYNLGFYYQ